MNAKAKWTKERKEWSPLVYDPIRSRAIANVRERQEKELERFRMSVDQDELEVAEFDRLVGIEAAKRFPKRGTTVRRRSTRRRKGAA